jgi:hypothetical protein
MAIIEHSKTVLHRGREAPEILEEETAELAETLQRRVPTPAEREQMIAQAAYYRAQARHFAPGRELEDWLEAEAELKAKLEWP